MRIAQIRFLMLLLALASGLVMAQQSTSTPASEAPAGLPVWIDADTTCTASVRTDPSACFAIAQALRDPRLRVLGISSSFGQSQGLKPFRTTVEWVRRLGYYTPVHLGYQRAFRSTAEMATVTRENSVPDAVAALYQLLSRTDEKITFLMLGPATNLAMTLNIFPELRTRVQAVIMVGGLQVKDEYWQPTPGVLPMHDVPVDDDPGALAFLLQMRINLTFIPRRVGLMFPLRSADRDRMQVDAALSWALEGTGAWLWAWQWLHGVDGAPLFANLVVLRVTHPHLFGCREIDANITQRSVFWHDGWALELRSSGRVYPRPAMPSPGQALRAEALGWTARQRCVIRPAVKADASVPSEDRFPGWVKLLKVKAAKSG